MKSINYILSALLLCPLLVSAQGILEEVVVTAQKREEGIQDIPLSVTALSGEQMDALGMKDFTEVTQQMPSVQLNTYSPKFTIFNLRGISQNNFNDNLEAPVAVYVDDVYKASMNGLSGQLFDMERVEVLRGPQGTLFGRNATGGLIHYISRGADDEETNGYLEAEYGNLDRKSFEGAVGGALSDSVRYRISGRWNQQDGYIKSQDTIAPSGDLLFPGSGQDIGGADGYALRANVQVDFSSQLTGSFWVKYDEDNNVPTGGYVFESCPFVNPTDCAQDQFGRAITNGFTADFFGNPTSPHNNFGDHPGLMNRNKLDFVGRFDYELDNGMELVSITNYYEMDMEYDEDGDALALPILTFQTFVPDYSQWSQELRLSGETDRMRWQLGGYYLDLNVDGGTSVTGAPGFNQVVATGRVVQAGGVDTALATANPFNGFEGAVSSQDYMIDSRNWSLFGQLDYDITDKLMATLGLRWSQDDKDIDWRLFFTDNFNPVALDIETDDGYVDATLDPTPDPVLSVSNPTANVIDYGDWAGRFALNYQFNDNIMGFASVNRGIKGGNWSLGGSPNLFSQTFKHREEVVWSYEAGFKSDWETFRLNGTFFVYDYDDYQAFSLASFGPVIRNSDAKSHGGELEFFWYPNENWDISLGGAYLDTEVDEVLGIATQITPAGVTGNPITNAEFPNAPELSANYLVRYNMNVANGNISVQIDGAWYDDQFLEVTNGSGTVQKAYNVSNARATWTDGSEKYSISAWVKNFTDEKYKLYSLDLGFLGATTYYAPPITYGITGRMNF